MRRVVLGLLWMAAFAAAWGQGNLWTPDHLSDDAGAEAYNLECTVTPGSGTGVTLATEWADARAAVLLTIGAAQISLGTSKDGKSVPAASAKATLTRGVPVRVTLLRRAGWLGVLLNDTLLCGADVPHGPGAAVTLVATAGWTATATLQPLEPVAFADDFMRRDAAGWSTRAGTWGLQSAWEGNPKAQQQLDAASAQNPFAYVGRGRAEQPAVSTAAAGRPFWDDYVFTVAVRPPADGAVGVLVNLREGRDGLLVRWSPAGEAGPRGNRLQLCRWRDGVATVLADSPGGTVPGQWFTLRVTSSLREGVQVAVDDRVRIPFTPVTPRRGGVGLYTESATGATFDDVTVFGRALDVGLLQERLSTVLADKFTADPEMKAWARTASDWEPVPVKVALFKHRCDFYGDQRFVATVKPTAGDGALTLGLCTRGDFLSGYRAEVKREGETTTATLCRDATILAAQAIPACTAGEEYAFRLLRVGNTITLQRDGEPLVRADDPGPVPDGLRPIYQATGAFARVRDLVVTSPNARDYTFATAPTDWLAEGTWEPSVRWTCAPQWSFLAGWSRGDVALWHKARFTGDITLQAFLGIKMEYPRATAVYEERFRGLGVTICGDGRNPRQGYALIVGAPDDAGNPNRRTVLLRNGVVVATSPQRMPDKTYGHHTWFALTLARHGADIDAGVRYVSKNMWWHGDPGREVAFTLHFTDPAPLEAGVPAVWSSDNGITLARARLFFRNPAQPRTEPLVPAPVLAYPEWHDVGTPLVLPLPAPAASDGSRVTVMVVPAQVPAGDEGAAVVAGGTLRFTPTKAGAHWYTVAATTKNASSPAAHLSLPVFDPAVGRDDTRAVLLYRFDEGAGRVVKDHGTGPAADLTIPDGAVTRWLPGRGLFFQGPQPLQAASVKKLMALAKSQAGTIELWTSAATNDTPTGSIGCYVAWGEARGDRNFTCAHQWYTPQLLGPHANYIYHQQKWDGPHWVSHYWELQYHPFLQHVVFAWDGARATVYTDGRARGSNGNLTGFSNDWRDDAPLTVGNVPSLSQNFIGTFYLLAVHDRCLTADDVKRHYQAGPGAR
jgi:hypothetical protein